MKLARKSAVRWFLDELNQGRFDVLDEFYAPDLIDRRGDRAYGRADLRDEIEALHSAMPDCNRQVTLLVANEDLVAYRMILSGTFEQPYSYPSTYRMPEASGRVPMRLAEACPTGEVVRLPISVIARFDDAGRCRDQWQAFDRHDLFGQLVGAPERIVPDGLECCLLGPNGDRLEVRPLRQQEMVRRFTTELYEARSSAREMLDIVTEDYEHHVNGFPPMALESFLEGHRDRILSAVSNYRVAMDTFVAEGEWLAAICRTPPDTVFDGHWEWPDGSVSRGDGRTFVEASLQFFHFDADGRISATWHSVDLLTVFAQFDVG